MCCKPFGFLVFSIKYKHLHSPSSGRIRECVESTTLGGFQFDVGECFQPAVYAVHHDPEHWGPEPVDEFVPER